MKTFGHYRLMPALKPVTATSMLNRLQDKRGLWWREWQTGLVFRDYLWWTFISGMGVFTMFGLWFLFGW
jgi:hypothetical protein